MAGSVRPEASCAIAATIIATVQKSLIVSTRFRDMLFTESCAKARTAILKYILFGLCLDAII
ncbi:MAG: hypothetical protein HLUCCO17_06355 [Saliniramus fredricksonii]|uniref:Uncharacterized protein n=1 Tax=Saliniramus fredricksonii TaxID=1653334 RepID=A0A0P7X8G3_9HYPH|nr:MAG: hypothetical protein HLUCCO17_06355 [Saliniramus fredricksonii]SCC82433.1 hypothetical protein GA0071312_3425 [Saliniramus fredricksonii]